MSHFSSEPATQHSRVQSYLRDALPDCSFTAERTLQGYAPLILVWMTHLMAAFAFVREDPRASYHKLYRSFKDYYAINRRRLDTLDLSFVLCVAPSLPNFDEFRSEIENDVYFCRKYVVPLSDKLDESFDRLPFLPLASSSGDSRRPPAAQTYMQQCGVPATLARQLAVPHQRSAENIVRDCIENASRSAPMLLGRDEMRVSRVARTSVVDNVRLESITIQNFRAYRKPQEFDLTGDVTVLYGPNGFGKTSFFDAIDFVATGGVGRLRMSSSTARFERSAAHLDSDPRDSSVSLVYSSNGVRRTLFRRVADRMSAFVDGLDNDRKRVLAALTGGGTGHDDRVEHLVSLFRATHIFGQEHQEIRKDFDRDCALPPQVVSRMLAFDDYANARRKAHDVCHILGESIGQRKNYVSELYREIEEAERALYSLAKASLDHGEAANPAQAIELLRERVIDAGIRVDSAPDDRTFVRACRAAIQAKVAETLSKTTRLSELAEQVRALPSVLSSLSSLRKQHDRATAEFEAAGPARAEAEEAQEHTRLLANEFSENRSRLRSVAEELRRARSTQPRYANLLERSRACEQAVSDGSRSIGNLRAHRIKEASALRSRETRSRDLEARLAMMSRVLSELDNLSSAAASVRADRERIRTLDALVASCRVRLNDLTAAQQATQSKLTAQIEYHDEVAQRVDKSEYAEATVSEFLSRISAHLESTSCPLCGHDHGTQEQLVARIGARPTTSGATTALQNELTRARTRKEEFQTLLDELKESARKEMRSVDESSKERIDLNSRISQFEETAAQLGIMFNAERPVIDQIQTRQANDQSQIGQMRIEVSALHDELRRRKMRLGDADRSIEAASNAVNDSQAEMDACQQEILRLGHNSRPPELWLETNLEELEQLAERNNAQLKEVEFALNEAVGEQQKHRESARQHRQRVSALESSLDTIRTEIALKRRAASDTNARVIECGLSLEANETDVASLLEEATKESAAIAILSDFADSVELAVDTATTAAASRQQRELIQQKTRQISVVENQIGVHEKWSNFFAELTELLSAKQNAAITRFSVGYGPLASAIQQRLRSVYGFQGIDTRSHDATIQVRVKRGDKTLRPTDYFSHSQQQTLLLGLFLTAGMSQSWSSLSTIFLDDPIMQFDDLNTYAFFDLIVGLLRAPWGPQQFIISTCDQKVFHLARSKLRYLDKDARFYEYSAIGPDGPVVKTVPSS